MKLFLFIGLIFFLSCEDKCDGDLNLGNVRFDDSTRKYFLPSKGKSKIVYKDSLNNESIFNVLFKNTTKDNLVPVDSKGCPTRNYISNLEQILVEMSNTSKNIHLDYWIDMDLIGPAYTTDREDIIHCLMNKIVNPNDLGTGLFYETVFKSGKLIPLKKSNVVFFGKTYTDVSISQYISPEKCYLHESVGILAFRDFDNKLWVFDRFE